MGRNIILTPECQDLWLLSPSMVFNYDQIVIDYDDYNNIVNPKEETQLKKFKAEVLTKLDKLGLIKTISYPEKLDNLKFSIHNYAENFIDSLVRKIDLTSFKETQFCKLAVHTHEEYKDYLIKSILANSIKDKNEFRSFIVRYRKVIDRINKLMADVISEELIEEVSFTLKRIAAKALAGFLIACNTKNEFLYDTKEYQPFVRQIISKCANKDIVYNYNPENQVYEFVINALSMHSDPSILDKTKLFYIIDNIDQFQEIKESLRIIEDYFKELIDTDKKLAKEKIIKETERINQEYLDRINYIKEKYNLSNNKDSFDIVSFEPLSVINNYFKDEYNHTIKLFVNGNIGKSILEENNVRSALFYVSQLWNSNRKIEGKGKIEIKSKNNENYLIWGEDKNILPWYERN